MEVAVLIWCDPRRDDVIRVFEKQYQAIEAAQTIAQDQRNFFKLREQDLTHAMEDNGWVYFAAEDDTGRSVRVITKEVE